MVQHLNGGLLYENEQREILYVNQPFCSLFDIDAPPDALVGTDCAAGTEAAAALMRDPDAFVDTIEARIAAKEPVASDVVERADGRIYERDFIPVFTDDGVYKGHLWHYRDVTEHRRAEHQLRASKRQLAAEQDFTESVLNTLVDLFMVLTPEGDFVRWNDQLPRVTGYTAEELSTVNMSQFFDRPELERVQAAVSEVLSEGAATVETFLRTKHDGAIPYEFTGSLLSTDDGQELICVVGRDITERKEAEEALQQERDLLESIMDTSVAAIAVADTAGRVIFANERAEAVLRLSATAHRGLPYANLSWILADEEGQPLAPAKHPTQRVVQTGAPLFNVAYRAVWPDGAQRSLAINAAPLTDDAGQVVRVVLSIEDVTERRRAEAALAQSERKYRTLFDASNDAIVLHTPEGEVIDANARMAELFDVPREEIIGGAIRDAHPPEALDAAQAALAELRQEGSVRFQVPCLRHDGSRFWGEISASLIQLNGETVVQGIVRDITAQKRTAEHLQQALEKERELGELKSRFVSMASHELRTPLATIQSSAELAGLFMNRGTGEKADKHLVRIQKNVGKMTELLEDVLLFGRAESGRLPFRPEPVDLGSVARELLRDVRQGLGADHVFEVEGVEAAGTIEADEQLIRLTLSNLLSNAVKYSDAGSTVTVAFERGEDVVRCAVTDAGIGIPEADQERLFEPFHRAENVGTIGGTGLGLSIVKEAVDLHGGSIAVESACDEGTTFRVAVPVAPTVPGEAPAQAASA
jgi:PAS domain S-box-containing protein